MTLTGNSDPTDRNVGLEFGADDYVSKLVPPREILARLRSLLRRPPLSPRPAIPVSPPIVAGQLRLDTAGRELLGLAGEIVHLTSAEYGTLRYLDDHRGQSVSRDDLSIAVLHRRFDAFDRSIDNLVSRLRKKIEAIGPDFRALKTVRGEGYVFLGFEANDLVKEDND